MPRKFGWESGLRPVRDESRSPFIGIRTFMYSLPLPGTLYLSQRNLKNHKWFWNLGYWRSFLDELAEDRYNALEFWTAEPWEEMIRLKSYPESSPLSPQRQERNARFFRQISRMAKDRGIDTYVTPGILIFRLRLPGLTTSRKGT